MIFNWAAFYTVLFIVVAVVGLISLVGATFFAFEKHWIAGTATAAGVTLIIAIIMGVVTGL